MTRVAVVQRDSRGRRAGGGFAPADPALAPWTGAKTMLLDKLTPRIEATPHKCFVDVFGGGGSVFAILLPESGGGAPPSAGAPAIYPALPALQPPEGPAVYGYSHG